MSKESGPVRRELHNLPELDQARLRQESRQLEKDRLFFNAHLTDLYEQYQGKYVAISGRRGISAGIGGTRNYYSEPAVLAFEDGQSSFLQCILDVALHNEWELTRIKTESAQ